MLGSLMDCPYCLSLWIAAPLAGLLADRLAPGCVAWLAISGGSSLIEKLVDSSQPSLDGDQRHVLLRTETSDADDGASLQAAHGPFDPRA